MHFYKIIGGKTTATVKMPHKQWTLVIGFDDDQAGKYTVGVNGVEMPDLPEAPKTAAS